jgi:hypothetical protein
MAENVVKSYMVIKSIGKSPFGSEPDTVEGEDTDGVVNSVAIGFIGTLALVAIGSGSTLQNGFICIISSLICHLHKVTNPFTPSFFFLSCIYVLDSIDDC